MRNTEDGSDIKRLWEFQTMREDKNLTVESVIKMMGTSNHFGKLSCLVSTKTRAIEQET